MNNHNIAVLSERHIAEKSGLIKGTNGADTLFGRVFITGAERKMRKDRTGLRTRETLDADVGNRERRSRAGKYECGGKRGYLYAKYVKKTADAAPSQPETPEAPEPPGVTPEGDGKGSTKVELATGKTNAKVNMRTGASTSGTGVLGTLAAGTKLNILAEMGDWYYVLYDGRTGFCCPKARWAYIRAIRQ